MDRKHLIQQHLIIEIMISAFTLGGMLTILYIFGEAR